MPKVSHITPVLPEEIRRICDALRVSVMFCDPDLHDMPVIYTNDAFSQLTGWSAAEILGNNCRILQGKRTDRTVTMEMAQYFKLQRGDTCALINYRASGEAFVNLLSVRPVRMHSNKIYMMACQADMPPCRAQHSLELHTEALGRALHLIRHGLPADKTALIDQDMLRLDSTLMRFQSAFVLVQNAVIRSAAATMLDRMGETVVTHTAEPDAPLISARI